MMKKSFLILAVAAAALASCSSDEVVSQNTTLTEPQQKEIGIMPLSQVITRSAIDGTGFPHAYDMMVSAYYNASAIGGSSANYFEGIQFGYDDTSDKWKSEKGAKYYPLEGTLDFLAVASAGYNVAANGIAPTANWDDDNVASEVVLTVPDNSGKFDDLLYGAANAQSISAAGTPMTFNHAMTSVVFNAKSNVDYNAVNNVGITINSITVKNAKQTGTLTISNPSAGGGSGALSATWSSLGDAADVAARVWNTTNSGDNASESVLANLNLTTSFCDMTTKKFGEGYVIIPPQNAVSFVISYTIHNGKNAIGDNLNNTLSYTYTPTGTWDMGKKNVYNITFTLTEIMIDPVVVDWTREDKVVLIPETLSALKTQINNGTDCSSYIGYYVDASGNISKTDVSAIGVIAAFTNSSTDADGDYVGSRIYVIAKSDGIGTGKAWASVGTTYEETSTGTNAVEPRGYTQTSGLYALSNTDFPAAKYAWEYQGKNGAAVITGSSGWFLPSEEQMIKIATNFSKLSSVLSLSTFYWTSNQDGGTAADARLVYINDEGSPLNFNLPKKSTYKACPCFVY